MIPPKMIKKYLDRIFMYVSLSRLLFRVPGLTSALCLWTSRLAGETLLATEGPKWSGNQRWVCHCWTKQRRSSDRRVVLAPFIRPPSGCPPVVCTLSYCSHSFFASFRIACIQLLAILFLWIRRYDWDCSKPILIKILKINDTYLPSLPSIV